LCLTVKSTFAYLAAAFCLLALVWAVSFGTLPPADFTFSNGSEIKTVDPAIVTGQPEGRIVWALFEGLCAWDPKTLEAVPGVAERWEQSEDKRTYTFYLRDAARWSDGTPVTAGDFVWSYRRFLHPQTASEYAYLLWYVDGAEAYTGAKVESGNRVEVELSDDPPPERPFAAGTIVRGELVAIEGGTETGSENGFPGGTKPVYVVEIDGRRRRFQQNAQLPGTEDYRWLLPDFHSVGIDAPDSRVVVFRLKHPVPYFTQLLGFYPLCPVNRRCVETHGYPAWTKPENIVVNGPFVLKFRRIRDRIRLVKNPSYWDREQVRLNVVDALAVESNPTNLNLYMTGQVDWIPAVPTEVVPELLKREEKDFVPDPYLSTYYYLINVSRPPLDDVRVRRALAAAVDKRQIVEKITRAGQKPARSLVPPQLSDSAGYRPAQCEPYDVAAARRLLAEAGYPGGRNFPRIEILYNTMESHQAIAELIQSQWKRNLGIDAGLVNQEWPSYLNSRRLGKYDVARAGWIGDYLDPNTFLELFISDNPNNQTRWANAEYDRLVLAAQQEVDEAKRMRTFEQAERILMDQMPVIPLYSYVDQNMVRSYVKGWYRNLQDVHPLKDVWIDQEEKRKVLEAEGLW
jgi:oligopeptide transport system substrate-binding protein